MTFYYWLLLGTPPPLSGLIIKKIFFPLLKSFVFIHRDLHSDPNLLASHDLLALTIWAISTPTLIDVK